MHAVCGTFQGSEYLPQTDRSFRITRHGGSPWGSSIFLLWEIIAKVHPAHSRIHLAETLCTAVSLLDEGPLSTHFPTKLACNGITLECNAAINKELIGPKNGLKFPKMLFGRQGPPIWRNCA